MKTLPLILLCVLSTILSASAGEQTSTLGGTSPGAESLGQLPPKRDADAGKEKEAGDANTAVPSAFKKLLEGKLIALEGREITKYEMKEEPKFYAFYFSAHWCPPCRAFTPKLVRFYNSKKESRKKDFEIIFVSSDKSEAEMQEYIKGDKMPWPVIGYENLPQMGEIRKYSGQGIPRLVLVDREGKVISDSFEGEEYVGPEKVMRDIPKKTKGDKTAAN